VLAICVGSIVGTGIYIRPAGIAQLLHTPGRVLLLWCAAGLLCLAGALTYAELAARFPRSGGEYAFLRETLGELPAFLFGWMRLTVGVGSMAALGAAVAIFVADLIPLAGTTWHLKLMSPWGNIPILLGVSQAVAALTILVLAVLNISGVARAGRFQGVITTLKVVGLTGLIVAIALLGRPHAAARHFIASSDAAPGVLAWGTALLAAVAAYDGWARVPMVAGEIRDPRRTLPWAIVTGLAIATVLYLTTNAAFLRVLTIDQVMASSSTAHPDAPSVASRAVATALSVNAAGLLSLLFLLSALGALHCGLLTVPRVLFAMARDGLLPRRLSGIAESARTPAVAITTVALLAVTLALLSGYERLSNMAVFGNLTFYAVNSFGLLWWRHRSTSRNDVALFRAPRGIPQLFLGAVLALLIVLVAGKSTEVLAGLALMGLGVPVYVAIRARRGAGTRVGAEHSQ
jgi:APA family basic amino acid/polyamine antiporter